MANLFESLRSYAGSWAVKSSRKLSDAEVASVKAAVVTDSQFGASVCFHMSNGAQKFIPLSKDSALSIGEEFPVAGAEVITLAKDGEADIIRIKEA